MRRHKLRLGLLICAGCLVAAVSARAEDAGPGGRTQHDLTGPPALVPNAGGATSTVAIPPATPPAVAPRVSPEQVMRFVDGLPGLGSWTVIPFAHFRRGDRHVVVAWPAINSSGRLVDATVVGICLSETAEGGLQEEGRRWVVREQAAARAALSRALGGEDYEVIGRDAGAPLDQLGPRLSTLGSDFAQAVARGDRTRARSAAADFAGLLSLERVAHENSVARLLWLAANHNGRLVHAGTTRQGDRAELRLRVTRNRRTLRTLTVQARRVPNRQNRWYVAAVPGF